MFRAQLPNACLDAASAVVSDSVLITGGQCDSVLKATAFYKVETDDWTNGNDNNDNNDARVNNSHSISGPDLLVPRYGHGLLVANI